MTQTQQRLGGRSGLLPISKGKNTLTFCSFLWNVSSRLSLLLKLFIVMGISWLFECVSSFYSFEKSETLRTIETAWDLINCLQGNRLNPHFWTIILTWFVPGVFIFFIFVCKSKVLDAFQKKVGLDKFRRHHNRSSGVTKSDTLMSGKQSQGNWVATRANFWISFVQCDQCEYFSAVWRYTLFMWEFGGRKSREMFSFL